MVLVVSITSIIRPATTTAMIITSASATASASRLAIIIIRVENFCMGYDKNLDCSGNYGFGSHCFDIGLGMNSDLVDLCHANCGL